MVGRGATRESAAAGAAVAFYERCCPSRLVPETTKSAEDGDRSLIVSFAVDPPEIGEGIEYLSITSYMAHMRALQSAYELRDEPSG